MTHAEAAARLREFVSSPLIENELTRDIRTLLDAVPVWQPIETAPKRYMDFPEITHGPEILGWGPKMGIQKMLWDSRRRATDNDGNVTGHIGVWSDCGEGFELEPTHWQHLPQPPQESK